MRTIRTMTALLLSVLLSLALSFALYASDSSPAGRYDASACVKDGIGYQCEGEYILLEEDGSGEIRFNNVVISLDWELTGSTLTITDEDGESASGTLDGGVINIVCYDYEYTYERSDSSLTGMIDEEEEAADGQDSLAVVEDLEKEPEADVSIPAADESVTADTGNQLSGTQQGPAVYVAESREDAGYGSNEESVWKYDYIALNDNGSGVFLYNKSALGIRWKSDGNSFSFTDHKGLEFTGSISGGRITGVYGNYRYSFVQAGQTLPSYGLSPEDWGKGLAGVVDDAGVLSQDKKQELIREAESMAQEYDVGVYLVFVRNLYDYTWTGDVSTLSEEIRSGYSLGVGSTEKKEKHEENPNQDWKDSILLTISVNDRRYDICASGDYANWAFPAYGREKIRDAFVDDLKENNWTAGAEDYLDSVGEVLKVAAKGKQISFRNDTTGRLIGIVVPAVLALLFGYGITAVMRSSMQDTQKAKTAAEYVAGNGVNFTRRQDRYIRTLVSRTYSPREKSGGGGGGGSFSSSSGSSHTSGSF